MICYRLVCVHEHTFEGWYKDSATFARLQGANLLTCPECGATQVRQALMAPAIAKGRKATGVAKERALTPDQAPQVQPTQGSNVPDRVMVAFQKMRQAVEQKCENMGDRFATEAVLIHHGEAPKRGIYGNATERERTMLQEEGVDVVAIPWVKRQES